MIYPSKGCYRYVETDNGSLKDFVEEEWTNFINFLFGKLNGVEIRGKYKLAQILKANAPEAVARMPLALVSLHLIILLIDMPYD